MKTILLTFFLITITKSTPIVTKQEAMQHLIAQQEVCNKSIHFNNYYYERETFLNLSGIPADISIHWKTENVFFTLISDNMKMSIVVAHNSGEVEQIKVAGLGQSTTVDNLNDIVYLATDNGVYRYKDDGSIELYTALGEDIMYMAVTADGGTMYVATWPQNRVFKITNDGKKMEMYPAIPNGHGLTVDVRNYIYFVDTKTSYILKNDQSVPIKITGLPKDKMTGIYVSRSDEVYAMDELSNLYLVDSENASAKHLGNFNIMGVNSFAIDAHDNVLIGTKGAIIKFAAKPNDPCKNITPKKVVKGQRHHKKGRKKPPKTTTTETPEEEEYEDESE